MTEKSYGKIVSCYIQYCEIIKPLVARIEALSERIPLPLFNEIRAFNDHIARCYFNNPSEEYISEQVAKASRHIVRLSLDCFKCLNVILYEQIERFEKQTRNVDLTVIDNGIFYPEYCRKKIKAAQCVNQAKINEGLDLDSALEDYERASNIYTEIVNLIDNISEKAKWARVRFTTRRILTIVLWVLSVIISAFISALFTCELFSNLIG